MKNKVEIGNCILYFGDCYDILKEIDDNSVTLVHSDPPYVIHSGSQKSEMKIYYVMNMLNQIQINMIKSGIFNLKILILLVILSLM